MAEGERPASDPRDPFGLAGTLLEKKYRVDRPVAEGGFGVVYAGHHVGLDQPIAIKALRPVPSRDDGTWGDALAQFMVEAKALARLRGSGAVTVYDSGVVHTDAAPEGVPWIVLEWIAGGTLADDLAARRGRGGRTPAECLALARPVLEAIAEAHENGIAHRDLKPSNVMLEPTKRGVTARVLDFGIAKMMEVDAVPTSGNTATDARSRAFSPAYAAPEQVSGSRTGPWTDVHALALLLTELSTDEAPYPIGDSHDLYRRVFDPTRPTPGTRGVKVGAWEAILGRALAIKPADRQPSARALLAELEAALPDAEAARAAAKGREVAETVRSGRGMVEPGQLTTGDAVASEGASLSPAHGPGRRWGRALGSVAGVALAAAAIGIWARGAKGPASKPLAPAPACATNAACTKAAGGQPALCRKDRGCVALASIDCSVHADPRALDSADTVWLGTMFPMTGPDIDDGVVNSQGVELARRDFAQTMAGMTTAGGTDAARPFGIVACDDAADARRAALHLVDDVGAPAVIGFHTGAEVIELASSLFVPRGVLAISATNTNPLVTSVPEPQGAPRLVWRTTNNSVVTARALSALTHDALEPQLRRPGGGLAPHERMRVALLRRANVAGAAFSETVFGSLVFNGKSALANGADFREVTYAPEARTEADYTHALDELVALRPHVVLFDPAVGIPDHVFAPLEQRWPDARSPRPRYAGASNLNDELLRFVGEDGDRRRRVFGITLGSSTAENARFVMHYNETFSDHTTATDAPNNAYDAFYLLAYAAYASQGPVTGASLSGSFARLERGPRRIEVGLTGIFEAFSALRRGEDVDLVGSSGSLDLDPRTGETPLDLAIVCAGVDAHGRANEGVESGLIYRAASGRLEGTMRCP